MDLILLKEIQAEKEKNQNKSKQKKKKPLSADIGKAGKNKLVNNIAKESKEPKIKEINNYHPMANLEIKNTFYIPKIKEKKIII